MVHFAAESHVDRSIVNPDEFVSTNCLGTNVMCDVARRVGVERFLHISTDEVYGSIETGSFREDDRLSPRSPYSASKAGSDLIALSYLETYGLPVIVTRSSNNFGPYQYPEKVIPLFVTNLLEGRKVPLYGDGLNVRDWCYVDDNCAGVDLVVRQGEVGEIYNIGAGNEITNRDITEPGSGAVPADRQSHVPIDRVAATREVMAEVARRHPDVELMLCASGGGRSDLDTLQWFHELWTSDNTDPVDRVRIQWGASHLLPASVLGQGCSSRRGELLLGVKNACIKRYRGGEADEVAAELRPFGAARG